jgi:RNA polymerase sigma-70 factor (ECF subfamily)
VGTDEFAVPGASDDHASTARAGGPALSTTVDFGTVATRPETLASSDDVLREMEQYRRELTGYCYRMLGSGFEADDAVQDTMVRAWKGIDGFEGRSALRSWLYRIATNVCLDMLRSRQRRARPMEMGPSSTADASLNPVLPEHAWVSPIPDASVLSDGDPADVATERETIRLAFVAALQHLPARQRAVLILREVLRWQATEVAELLDTTVASVNSALQRARATLADCDLDSARGGVIDADQQALLARYVDAFERYDIPQLVSLLHDDAIMSMPPFDLWLEGPTEISRWFVGQGIGCKGSRLVATAANGSPAFGSYRIDPDGGFKPWALQIIDVAGDKIVGHHSFVVGYDDAPNPGLFAAFGLPAHLDD